MKGIRDLALNPEPTKTEYLGHQTSFADDGWDKGEYFGKGYLPEKPIKTPKGQLNIRMSFDIEELGPIADETSDDYSWIKATTLAEEMAYDKMKEIMNKDFESKYMLAFEVIDGYSDYTVEVTLTPTT